MAQMQFPVVRTEAKPDDGSTIQIPLEVHVPGILRFVRALLEEREVEKATELLIEGLGLSAADAETHLRETGLLTEHQLEAERFRLEQSVQFRLEQEALNKAPISPVSFADILARHVVVKE